MSNAFQLPEKEFFSIKEIAERWSCDVFYVEQLIFDERTLRISISKNGIRRLVSPLSILTDDEFLKLPKFLYFCREVVFEPPPDLEREVSERSQIVGVIEDFNGDKYSFKTARGEMAILYARIVLNSVGKNVFLSHVTPDESTTENGREVSSNGAWLGLEEFCITREERDRFERVNSKLESLNTQPDSEKRPEQGWRDLPTKRLSDFGELCVGIANSLKRIPKREELEIQLVRRHGEGFNIARASSKGDSLIYDGKVISIKNLNRAIISMRKKRDELNP